MGLSKLHPATDWELENLKGIIYLIKNKINNKIYVGKTRRTFYLRYGKFWWRRKIFNKHFSGAICLYGQEAFEIYVLMYDLNDLELKIFERFFINSFNAEDPIYGYNKTKGGEGFGPTKNSNALSNDEFVSKASIIHNNFYNYSKTNYITCKQKVIITCPIHGDFLVFPHSHLQGISCRKCGNTKISKSKRMNQQKFLKLANQVHNNYYDYTLTKYLTNKIKVVIVCPKHGPFEQQPSRHLLGSGCKICGIERSAQKQKLTIKELKERIFLKHGIKYKYDFNTYINFANKICIECPSHGKFYQILANHLSGEGCPVCATISRKETKNKYDSY